MAEEIHEVEAASAIKAADYTPRQQQILIPALWGMAGGAVGWLFDFLFLQDSNLFGVGAKTLAGLGIGWSSARLADLKVKRTIVSLGAVPALWIGVTLLLQYLLVYQAWVTRAAYALEFNVRIVDAYFTGYYPFIEWLLGGAAVGAAVVLTVRANSWRDYLLLPLGGLAGAFIGLFVSLIVSQLIIMFFTFNPGLMPQVNKSFKIVDGCLLAAIQLYCINLALLWSLRRSSLAGRRDHNSY